MKHWNDFKNSNAILKSKDRLKKLLNQAESKSLRLSRSSQDTIQIFFRLLRAWSKGEYKAIPWQSLLMIVGFLVYLVNPWDGIPDFIFGFGLLDDLTLLGWVAKSIKHDLELFQQWEAKKIEQGSDSS